MRTVIVFALAFAAAGCAPLTAYLTRDANENEVSLHRQDEGLSMRGGAHRFSTIAFTANRRGAYITTDSARAEGQTIFCAEPPPDAISAILASSSADIGFTGVNGQNAKAAILDQYKSAAASIAARSQYVEIYRTYVFALCQLYANKATDNPALLQQFQDVTVKTLIEAKGAALVGLNNVAIQSPTPETQPAEDGGRCSAETGDAKTKCDAAVQTCASKAKADRKKCEDDILATKPPTDDIVVTDCSKFKSADEKAKCETALAEWKKCQDKPIGDERTKCETDHPMPKPAQPPAKKVGLRIH